MSHIYISTACQHDLHGRCRRTCKFCDEACLCLCHSRIQSKESAMTEPLDNPAAPDADSDEPAPYGADDAVADDQDHLAEQTDNSGEDEAEDDAPQEPDAVSDDDSDDDGDEPDPGDDDGE